MENQWDFDPSETDDPYERGFADKLYENMDEPQYIVDDEDNKPYQKPLRKHPFLKILTFLLIIAAAFAVFLTIYSDMPKESSDHKSNVSTILIAGTDESGLRTDTLMLLCMDRENGLINIMSIPRDTKVNSSYWPQKINLAYHMNGTGEEGMYWLMDYVRQCVGFMPDGYVLVDLNCFIDLVDLFGGVEFDVPCRMYYSDPAQNLYIDLQPGLQKLDGKESMGLVRFRSGYAMADLERVNVQRDFMMSALKQWASVKNLPKLYSAMQIVLDHSVTDLSARNLLWYAFSAVICGTDDMTMTTIPYYLSGDYVCIALDENYLNLINEYFNPMKKPVEYSDFNVAG